MRPTFVLFLLLVHSVAFAAPVPVTVDAKLGMRRAGEQYFVKGAGGETELERLAARGANSIRTWGTETLANTLADAERFGLTVSAGIWLESECSWFSYAKPEHCAQQAERVRQEVLKFRAHPALLAWGIGNESEGDGTNVAYWQQLERLAVLVKELDPAHPTFTAVAGLSAQKASGLNQYTPHLDFVGVNTYGGLFSLREHLRKVGWTRPWLVTEWGPQGFWERPKGKSGAPLEQTSTEKAAMMARVYDQVIAQGPACLGSYAFVWGWKFEATATWFGLLTHRGETTAAVDALEEKWTGRQPANRAPATQSIQGVPADPLSPGTKLTVHVPATDPEGDPLSWTWAVLPEAVRHEPGKTPPMPAAIPDTIIATRSNEATVQAPAKPGIYRLYVWISDGKGHAATANTPFEVKDSG
jgi:hypothetical protein